MKTFDFPGGLYIGFSRSIPGAPPAWWMDVMELDGECRISHALAVRLLPLRRAVYFGKWQPSGMKPPDVFAAHYHAREILDAEYLDIVERHKAQRARDFIASHAEGDADAEWQILDTMGLV